MKGKERVRELTVEPHIPPRLTSSAAMHIEATQRVRHICVIELLMSDIFESSYNKIYVLVRELTVAPHIPPPD